ncbi:MAG: hypothetical protein IJX77_01660 [Ruminococcus sp.]|nr:hypothetical protein [Ruminococcus sp.]
MKGKEQENSNSLRMTISDPELVQKIRESGIESLSPDDLNSLGIEVKDGQMFLGDASQANLQGANRVRLKTVQGGKSEPSPLKRGVVGYIAVLLVVLVVLSIIGIISCKMFLPSLTYKDMIFISLFFVVGLGICLNEFRTASAAKKYLTERVQGKCISHESASGTGNLRKKRSIFEYTYRDKVYRSCESVFANKGYAKLGEVRELMISPENPRCIYDPIAGKARKIGGITIGMIFIVITAVVVVCVYING